MVRVVLATILAFVGAFAAYAPLIPTSLGVPLPVAAIAVLFVLLLVGEFRLAHRSLPLPQDHADALRRMCATALEDVRAGRPINLAGGEFGKVWRDSLTAHKHHVVEGLDRWDELVTIEAEGAARVFARAQRAAADLPQAITEPAQAVGILNATARKAAGYQVPTPASGWSVQPVPGFVGRVVFYGSVGLFNLPDPAADGLDLERQYDALLDGIRDWNEVMVARARREELESQRQNMIAMLAALSISHDWRVAQDCALCPRP